MKQDDCGELGVSEADIVDDSLDHYHIVCFRHKGHNGATLFWGPDSAGYTTDITKAGTYFKRELKKFSGLSEDIPVPVDFFSRLRRRITIDPTDEGNQDLLSADKLKKAIGVFSA